MANTNKINNESIIEFFGPIESFWGIDLESFSASLSRVEGEDLQILIHSPGGEAFEAFAISEMIARRSGKTTATGIGLVASAATIVLMSADTVQMSQNATLMIHDALMDGFSNAEQKIKEAEILENISDTLAKAYTYQIQKNGKLIGGDFEKTKDSVREQMKAETWLTAQEALDMGLIDKIVTGSRDIEEMQISGQRRTDTAKAFRACLKNYKNTPNQILNTYQMQEDKKTLWQAIKAFFGAEIKAEAEAMQQPQPEPAEKEPEVKPEPTQKKEMTKEEMIAALAAEGYEVEKKPEPVAEKDPVAEMQAQIKALQDELKASKIKAAAQPAGGTEPKAKKEKTVWTDERLTVFNGLAELAKTHRR